MSRYTQNEIDAIKELITGKIKSVEEDICTYTELSKPISPENAIGRISRMDAINNKSINEAALRNSKQKLVRLKSTLSQLQSDQFGLCRQCGKMIEFEKLKVIPESVRCIECVKSQR